MVSKKIALIRKHRADIARAIEARGFGFILSSDASELAKVEELRLMPCLVRCGNGRFTCAMQDVGHFVNIIDQEGSDYVRDVCLTVDC